MDLMDIKKDLDNLVGESIDLVSKILNKGVVTGGVQAYDALFEDLKKSGKNVFTKDEIIELIKSSKDDLLETFNEK